jgi:putative ABC transport system permease protein
MILYLLTAILTVVIFISAIRNKILRQIGFRNILRRKTTTALVIFGSLIGTALIAGSLTLGDSFNKSTRIQAENTLGEIDAELKINRNNQDFTRSFDFQNAIDPALTVFSKNDSEKITKNLDNSKIDGILSALMFSTSVIKGDDVTDISHSLSATNIDLIAFENTKFASENINFNIENGKAIVSDELAKRLDLKAGDKILVFNGTKPIKLEVQEINSKKGASAFTEGNGNLIVSQDFLRKEFGLPQDSFNRLLVSSKGGFYEPTYDAGKFTEYLKSITEKNKSPDFTWAISEKKAASITGGNDFIVYAFLGVSIVGVIAGILLIINIYSMLAEERKSEMGTLRAIALTRSKLIKTFLYEGFVYSVISSILGVIIGVGVGYVLLNTIMALQKEIPDAESFKIVFDTNPSTWFTAFCIGLLITFVTSYIASRRISKINIVSAIRNAEDEKDIKRSKWSIFRTVIQILLLVNFIGLTGYGLYLLKSPSKSSINDIISQESLGAYLLFLGVIFSCFILSLLIGKILNARGKENYKRIVITSLNIPPLLLSLFIARIDFFVKVFESILGYSLLLLAGLTIVITLTTVITYNLDILLWIIEKTIGRIPRFNGILKLALRYSGENKFRTGLTILMFSLVLFLVAFLSVFKLTIDNQLEKFIPKSGYNAFVTAPKIVNVDEVKNKVEKLNVTDDIEISKSIILNYENLTRGELGFPNQTEAKEYVRLAGVNKHFFEQNPIKLAAISKEFATQEDAINAALNTGKYVFLTPEALGVKTYVQPPEKLALGKTVTFVQNGKKVDLIIAGYFDPVSSQNYTIFQYGYITGDKIFSEVLDKTYVDNFYENNIFFKLKENGKSKNEILRQIQQELIPYNLASRLFSIAQIFAQVSSFIKGAISILQGFLSFALFVGIAGIAIIMVRSVNERKQQIGMLRSLGFQRRSVLISFFLEASFIIFLGILIGIASGAITGDIFFTARNNAIQNVGISDSAKVVISIPYGELINIGLSVYVISILFTLLPSYKASRLEPVEATNYLD